MIRNHYDEEHEAFRDAFRTFLEREAIPNRAQYRADGMVSRDLYRKMGEQGFLCSWVPEEYGGLGLTDFRYDQVMMEEVGRSLESGIWTGALNRNSPPYIGKYGSEETKRHFLPKLASGEMICAIAMTEPDAGSDIAGFKTRAEQRPDGTWVLNGSKTYISYGLIAELFVVAAKTDVNNKRQLGLFLVERGMPGFSNGRKLEKLGFHTQDTAELIFEDVVLQPIHVLGDPAKGFDYMRGGLAEERLTTAAQSLPWSQKAIELTLDFVTQRKAFGQTVADFQNTKFKLAEMQTEVNACQAFLDHCARLFNAGQLDQATAASLKLKTSEVQGRIVDECLQLHGSAGYMQEYPICQLYQDARIFRIFAGTSEVMKIVIAKDLMGR
ncbi:acyl-CoA dehydrogenase family protein [Sphingomonas sp. CA1-15]|uniref:Acyl-CoA dehydrogenase family protein n=2 Tax=Sphingomonas immobilis TaxID=3063997 RepID=A0ABT9A0S9_9SPHN|nr:acyl-CoA dehydrogenase family protein [Sphingomonas sp. CA1-15]